MDLESELRKFLLRRAASNESVALEEAAPQVPVEIEVPLEPGVDVSTDWSPSPWSRDAWRARAA
jgi:hypothetical protein